MQDITFDRASHFLQNIRDITFHILHRPVQIRWRRIGRFYRNVCSRIQH